MYAKIADLTMVRAFFITPYFGKKIIVNCPLSIVHCYKAKILPLLLKKLHIG